MGCEAALHPKVSLVRAESSGWAGAVGGLWGWQGVTVLLPQLGWHLSAGVSWAGDLPTRAASTVELWPQDIDWKLRS